MHTADGVADRFLSDVEEELAIIMKDPSKPVEGKVSAYLFIALMSYYEEPNFLSCGVPFILYVLRLSQ
jgi:hypothetical protein